jgi:hypothetical protein
MWHEKSRTRLDSSLGWRAGKHIIWKLNVCSLCESMRNCKAAYCVLRFLKGDRGKVFDFGKCILL